MTKIIFLATSERKDLFQIDPDQFAVMGFSAGGHLAASMCTLSVGFSRYGLPSRYRVFPGISHGWGLGEETAAEGWLSEAVAFWESK